MDQKANRDMDDDHFRKLMDKLDSIDRKIDRMSRVKEALDGDKLLDNHDMCLLLGVTKRTLQRYRQFKKVTYYRIDGKTYYKSSEVKEFLKKYDRIYNTKNSGNGNVDYR